MFSGLRSRCMIRFSCIWARPSRSPFIKVLIYNFEKCPLFWNKLNFYLLNFVEKLTAWQNFQHNVNRVLRLKNTFKTEQVRMTQASHNCELIYQTFFSVFCGKSVLFRKGLHCKPSEVCQPFNFINRGKISFSKFFDWLEKLMESLLVNELGKVDNPNFD